MPKEDWFKEWFDTEYYHLLYNKRNDEEARWFITEVANLLGLPKGASVSDIACGKGRHTRVLAGLGFQAKGYDLSPNSIAFAKAQNTPGAEFFVHDIREPFPHQGFDAAFNLFTSFGYFEDVKDDQRCLSNIFAMLKPGGHFVQDYLNGAAYTDCMPMNGDEKRGNVCFHYAKKWVPPFIIKDIEVEDQGTVKHFREKVKVYELAELKALHEETGFEVIHVYGDYHLTEFKPDFSPRMILISKKKDV